MIIRVLGVGQYRVPEERMADIQALDAAVQRTVEELAARFRADVTVLADAVAAAGTPLAVEEIVPSEAVVPGPDTSLGDAIGMLTEEGLIPG